MRRKALSQSGEFRDGLAHRLIGDTLGGLDEIGVDRDSARVDPLIELPNLLLWRWQRAEPSLMHGLKREDIDPVIFGNPRDDRRGELWIKAGLAVRPRRLLTNR